MPAHLDRAGDWFLRSGIQEPNGGVARYYHAGLSQNQAISTEISGYSASAFIYLHSLVKDRGYRERAIAAARFLTSAWDPALRAMPFETAAPAYTYFFDCGIVVRGLLAAWRASGVDEFCEVAAALGQSMAADFTAPDGGFHPILSLPYKQPVERDPARWSRSPGCYQLKSAMAWWDLFEATGDASFREPYDRAVEYALRSWRGFLPGHPDRLKVMDRLHAFLYFLEGLLPRAGEPRCARAISDGIRCTEGYLREIGPEFERADVVAQLLRIRLYAAYAGATMLDRVAAGLEAAKLAEFQVSAPDPRIEGGFYFGRQGSQWLPHVSPVSTAFAMQALAMWENCLAGGIEPHRHLLI